MARCGPSVERSVPSTLLELEISSFHLCAPDPEQLGIQSGEAKGR